MTRSLPFRSLTSLLALLVLSACDPATRDASRPVSSDEPDSESEPSTDSERSEKEPSEQEPPEKEPSVQIESPPPTPPADSERDWFKARTISLRERVVMPSAAARLSASEIVAQLKRYDPGSLLRCEVQDDPNYRAVVDALGGVSWGYNVQLLDDYSQPEFRLGPALPIPLVPSAYAGAVDRGAVEIAEADIVGLSESAALFYSRSHGLLLVDLTAAEPRFKCGVKLPGNVKDFYYYRDHLVALLGGSLIHFKLVDGSIRFVESIKLNGESLDTRRFDDKLVVFTRFDLGQPTPSATTPPNPSLAGGASPAPGGRPPRREHRSLQVFKFGDMLHEELNESLINTTVDVAYLQNGGVAPDTAPGSVVNTASSYGDVLWASDHYFVVPETLTITKFEQWVTQNYQVCTQSHTVPTTYRYCETRYETRPNPNYVPPDNSGGDRACKGVTLSDCLHAVARAANPTIEVPVGVECRDSTYEQWVCDASENRSYTYPQLRTEAATRLTIFEYTEAGFVRLPGKVREVTTPALANASANATVAKLTTSSDTFDLSIPGYLQTLYFQKGFLYAIADGVLQVYAMGDSSLVRTSSLQVVNRTLQSSLFSDDKLYLSDFGYYWGANDQSTLRVIDLSNPGFPKQVSQDQMLPGGHTNILATSSGILTIGTVQNFEDELRNVLKLGLFADPFASEKAYLILGTDLYSAYLGDKKAHFFDSGENRLFLPYTGPERKSGAQRARMGVSHLLADEIVTEGALTMAELVQRVRPRPAAPGQYLSFAENSVSWLRRVDDKWSKSDLLSYYTPVALYRQNDRDDYVELSQLGSRCQLRLVNVSELNKRTLPSEDTSFECNGGVTAYGDALLFAGGGGVRFDAKGKVSVLDASEVSALNAKIVQRPVCLFSEMPTNQPVDYAHLPPMDTLKCYARSDYQALVSKL